MTVKYLWLFVAIIMFCGHVVWYALKLVIACFVFKDFFIKMIMLCVPFKFQGFFSITVWQFGSIFNLNEQCSFKARYSECFECYDAEVSSFRSGIKTAF